MPISFEEVRHVARLARLDLDEAELLAFQGELNALLGHFQDIDSLHLEGVAPKPHAVALSNVWADDVVGATLDRADAMRGAPKTRAGLFVTPTIIED